MTSPYTCLAQLSLHGVQVDGHCCLHAYSLGLVKRQRTSTNSNIQDTDNTMIGFSCYCWYDFLNLLLYLSMVVTEFLKNNKV